MLREIFTTRQNQRHSKKRWFTDSDMDLFIWFMDQVPVRFQLSYNKCGTEHSISWDAESGFSHNRVDSGEHYDPFKYKMTPILLDDGEFNSFTTARDFLAASDNMEESLADFIYARLLEYPCRHAKHPGQGSAPKDL